MTTHNDSAAISSSIGFISLLWDAIGMEMPPSRSWWVEHFISVLRDLDDGSLYEARGGAYADHGPARFSDYVERIVDDASRRGLPTLDACESFYSGAYLLETVPRVLYVLRQHGDDPEEAIVRAVNDTRDNDTIGAIVGAAVGALHGKQALPKRWLTVSVIARAEFDAGFPCSGAPACLPKRAQAHALRAGCGAHQRCAAGEPMAGRAAQDL